MDFRAIGRGFWALLMDDFSTNHETRALTVSVAGMGITFLYDADLPLPNAEKISPRFCEAAHEKIRLRVHRGRPVESGAKEKIFDSGETWALYKGNGKYVLQNDTLGTPSEPDIFLLLEPDLESGEAYLPDDGSRLNPLNDPLGYPLNQILMILLLSKGEGLLLHACGIDDKGKGYLFLGNSTHGKSTMASFWSQNRATVLNDDRVIVRDRGPSFWLYGTPWHGDFRAFSTRGLPVSKIFFLRHGETNAATPKRGAEAVSMILARSFPPLWDKGGMAFTMDLCHRLVNETPCFELRFRPDDSIVDFVRHL